MDGLWSRFQNRNVAFSAVEVWFGLGPAIKFCLEHVNINYVLLHRFFQLTSMPCGQRLSVDENRNEHEVH